MGDGSICLPIDRLAALVKPRALQNVYVIAYTAGLQASSTTSASFASSRPTTRLSGSPSRRMIAPPLCSVVGELRRIRS